MLSRYVLFAMLSVAMPAIWYVGFIEWIEPGTGPVYSALVPRRAYVLWLPPLLSIVTAWWLLVPRPRVEALKLLVLGVSLPIGLTLGFFLGLTFLCAYTSKCM
jgi:hypothetical protein